MRKVKIILKTFFITVILFVSNANAQLEIVRFPLIPVKQDSVSVISWVSLGEVADANVNMKFGSSPGGGILSNYPNSVNQASFDEVNGFPSLKLIPSQVRNDNNNRIMTTGRYYYVLYTQIGNNTVVSQEKSIIVESKNPVTMLSPITSDRDGIDETVPVFSWQANPGVPYYHIVVSDEPIEIDIESQSASGISAIWQAITPSTSIQYGTDDPSGEFDAQIPPPLFSGTTYNWIVLNNYGNTSILSSSVAGAPASFKIRGDLNLTKPENIFPVDGDLLNSSQNSEINFKWSSAGDEAYAYEVYLFIEDSIGGIEAKVNIWQATTTDTTLTMDAANTLYDNRYSWKVYAIDSRGSGIASDFTSFDYDIAVANLKVNTFTQIGNSTEPLPFVSLKAIPITGSADIIPFGTNNSGTMSPRPLLPGSYRIEGSKDGYISNEEVINLEEAGITYNVDIILEQAPASVFGRVLSQNTSSAIAQAQVKLSGPNNREITVVTNTNGSYSADIPVEGVWSVEVEKNGYISSQTLSFSVDRGESVNIEDIFITRNDYRIEGTVISNTGNPISRAEVSVVRVEDNFVYDRITTNDNGSFIFFVEYNNWKLIASAAGYASQTVEVERLTTNNEFEITLTKGGQITGTAYRRDYNVFSQSFNSPSQLANASVTATKKSTGESSTTTADAFGKYNLNVGYGTYYLSANMAGYTDTTLSTEITISSSNRTASGRNITLTSMGRIGGFTRTQQDSSLLRNVSISAVNANLERFNATSNNSGEFQISGLEDGEYTLSTAGIGFASPTVETVTIQSGIPSRIVEFYLEPSDFYNAEFTVLSADNTPTTSGNLFITSPFNISTRKTVNSFIADSLSLGLWTYSYFPTSQSVLGIEQASFTITTQSSSQIDLSVPLPFTHQSIDTIKNIDAENIKLPVELTVSGNNDYSAVLYYRQSRNSQFSQQAMIKEGNTFISEIDLNSTDITVEYYFVCTSLENDIVYSNRNSPYYSYIPAIARLDYTAFTPSLGTVSQPRTVLKGHPIRASVQPYYRGRIYTGLISSTRWISSDSSVVSFAVNITENSDNNTLYINRESSSPVLITAISTGIYGTRDTLSAKLNIIDGTIKNISITRTDKQVDDRTLSNRETGSFRVMGEIETQLGKTRVLQLPAMWYFEPSSAATMENNNLNVSNNFAGQLKISAVVQGQSRVYYNNNQSMRYRNRFLHVYAPVNEKDTVKNYKGLSLVFPENSFITPGTDELFIRETQMSSHQKIAQKYEAVGDIYIFSMNNNNEFNESVTLNYELPNEFQGRKSYALGFYNDSIMAFEIIRRDLEVSNNNILTTELEHFSTYAIMAEREPISIKNVVFSPNPFSPFVYARDNDARYKGLGIKFYCSTINDPTPDIKIEIFTTEGVKVWEQRGGSNITSGYQEFIWDGYTSDGRTMARNGRYIVKITAEEKSTGEKSVYKGVVVLIK